MNDSFFNLEYLIELVDRIQLVLEKKLNFKYFSYIHNMYYICVCIKILLFMLE